MLIKHQLTLKKSNYLNNMTREYTQDLRIKALEFVNGKNQYEIDNMLLNARYVYDFIAFGENTQNKDVKEDTKDIYKQGDAKKAEAIEKAKKTEPIKDRKYFKKLIDDSVAGLKKEKDGLVNIYNEKCVVDKIIGNRIDEKLAELDEEFKDVVIPKIEQKDRLANMYLSGDTKKEYSEVDFRKMEVDRGKKVHPVMYPPGKFNLPPDISNVVTKPHTVDTEVVQKHLPKIRKVDFNNRFVSNVDTFVLLSNIIAELDKLKEETPKTDEIQ